MEIHISKADLQGYDKIKRLNIVNSVSGVKPANLIGTQSEKGQTNLAIFSSVVHIGSNPALLGMFSRPDAEIRRDTLENIKESGYYTINHVPTKLIENAHFTSAKFNSAESEFDKCQFTPFWQDEFQAPYVKESPLKIGLQFKSAIPIPINGTLLIIGAIQHIYLADNALAEDGQIDLSQLQTAGISGLNRYYELSFLQEFPYARPNQLPDFKK